MRKISILSLIAVLAATPMMAEAARSIQKTDNLTITANTNVASTSYVQGAYNAANTKINDLIDDTAVAAKAEGQPDYVAVSASSTVGENLAALDTAIANASSAAATDVTTKINALNATVSQTEGDISVSVAETAGKLTSVSASINSGAVTTAKIANNTILVEDVATSALATTIADSATATDDKLATEKAVRTVVDSINNAASNLTDRVEDNEEAIELLNSDASQSGSVDYKIKTQAASADYTNASMSGITTISSAIGNLDTRLDTAEGNIGTLMGNGEGSVANTAANAAAGALSAAKTYVDNTTLTVYTTWNAGTSATVGLNTPNN